MSEFVTTSRTKRTAGAAFVTVCTLHERTCPSARDWYPLKGMTVDEFKAKADLFPNLYKLCKRCQGGGLPLTQAQQRVLADVRVAGVRTYNGRKRATVEALVQAGLVTAEFDLVLHASGPGTERITVRPVDADPTTE